MADRERDSEGRFELKGEEPRILRSMRLTDTCWETLGTIASERKCSRTDLIEALVEDGKYSDDSQADFEDAKQQIIESIQEVIESLNRNEEPLIDLENHRDKAPARRILTALIDYLS